MSSRKAIYPKSGNNVLQYGRPKGHHLLAVVKKSKPEFIFALPIMGMITVAARAQMD